MSEKMNNFIKIGILICLVIIAFKPVPSIEHEYSPFETSDNIQSIIPLGENRIAIINFDSQADTDGEILVFEYNEAEKDFSLAGTSNYFDIIESVE